MLKGVYLTLMIGPAVPVPAPREVMDAVASIQVTSSRERSGFQIVLNLSRSSTLLTTLLPAGYFDPISTRVIIVATLNGAPNVLMDGLITNHELAPSSEPGKSTLTVTGEDLSLAMDLFKLVVPFPAMPKYAQIMSLFAPFAALGIVPVVIPPIVPLVKVPIEGWDSQVKMTTREYIKSIASSCGYVFFLQPGPLPGQSIGYFGPDVNLPVPQSALTIDMDSATNVESLSFSMNGLAKTIRIYTILDPITKKVTIPIPVPNINILKPPLGLKPSPMWKTEFADDVSKLSPAEVAAKVIGDLIGSANNPPATTASGSLDVVRYNGIVRNGMLIGVRGAGITYDGLYYVDSVTHNIKPGEYKQNFTLSRDGLISNTPLLPV